MQSEQESIRKKHMQIAAPASETAASGGGEPAHSRDAPEITKPLTVGAQYLNPIQSWKKIVRGSRRALVCASPKTNTLVYE